MTRIVGGTAGGRQLKVPSAGTRPTGERVREALFSTLDTLLDLDGARVLDLYAGSGAVGLEALSRGAAHALLVESDGRAAALIRSNARDLDLKGAEVRADRLPRALQTGPAQPYDLVFADPPYALADPDLDDVLGQLTEHGWLAAGAVVVVERAKASREPVWPTPLSPVKQRRYGDAVLWYGHAV